MLSRVAERLYWMARYLERAENTARLVSSFSHSVLDLPETVERGWETLLGITSSDAEFHDRYQHANERNVVKFLLADRDNPISLVNSVRFARENARTTREILPSEAWEMINEIHLDLKANAQQSLARRKRYELLRRVNRASLQITGLLEGALERGMARRFTTLGRYLERADMSSRVLDVGAGSLLGPTDGTASAYEGLLWVRLLQTVNALPAYRTNVEPRVDAVLALDFLLHNNSFPRALASCLEVLNGAINALPRPEAPQKSLTAIRRRLRRFSPDPPDGKSLHKFLDRFQQDLTKLDRQFDADWFHPVAPATG